MLIRVGARGSPLALAQCDEVQKELPSVNFELLIIATSGDQDKRTSLRTLGKSDFFTKEIDQALLKQECRIAIHSAKDLPDPLPSGLQMIALTKGVDPSDSLVLRRGETLVSLPTAARIATSSERREEAVRQLRPDLRFIDLRGTIGERLSKLDSGEADGVVVAEAALIRLGLTHLNRVTLPGETAALQGQLAILAREGDREMEELFAALDVRKRVLYTGLEAPLPTPEGPKIIHCPLIQIIPRPFDTVREAFTELGSYTHLIFTSKSAVDIFCRYLNGQKIEGKQILAVGKATADRLREHGLSPSAVAEEERAEGIISLFEKNPPKEAYLFWPHSAGARPLLSDYFAQKGWRFRECLLYDTLPVSLKIVPDLSKIDEIHFTSPSTVEAFLKLFGALPKDKKLTAIGPITQAALEK